jgi:hypothetical protein
MGNLLKTGVNGKDIYLYIYTIAQSSRIGGRNCIGICSTDFFSLAGFVV